MLRITLALALFALTTVARADDGCVHSDAAHHAAAVDDRTFDETTGRDTRNYPPDVQVDFQHLLLEIDMPDPASKSFRAVETLTFKTLGRPAKSLKLNAVDLKIDKVTDLAGSELPFRTDDKTLTVTFPAPLSPQSEAGVKIAYSVTNPKDGLIFAVPDDAYPNRPLHVHSQGQAESNRYWFAAHDYPNERMTSEIVVTIPSQYKALANGALVERKENGGGKVTYHYKLAKPHVSYLVSLVIGEFDVYTDKWRDIPVEYWVPPGSSEADVRRTFKRTAEMLDTFSKLLGVDYPYEKYAQSVVCMFGAGGMENTSTTTLTEDMLMDERAAIDHDREGLIAHELAHQWYGDMLTCKSWQHIWLNEGFASYMDAAWHEHGLSRDHYDHELWETMHRVAGEDDVSARGGLVWPFYEDGWETFRREVSNPYRKGESVLHMLRQSVGDDELFWRIIGEYTRRHAWSSVESDDLRKVFDELTGRSFEQFFQQWVYRPGSPHVTVKYEWDGDAKEVLVTLKQTQTINEHSPAFVADVPVWVISGPGRIITKHTLEMAGRSATLTIPAEAEPEMVCVDPGMSFLAKWDVDLPTAMLQAIAKYGPTLGCRLEAVAQLSTKDKAGVVETLAGIMNDDKAFFGLRSQAAKSLGAMQTPAARKALILALEKDHMIADHKVRKVAVEALGKHRHDAAAETLRRIAMKDESYAVEAAAAEALGEQSSSRKNLDVLVTCADKPSYRDQIRIAAAKALAKSAAGEIQSSDAHAAIAALTTYGQPFRTRPAAIEALAAAGDGRSDVIRKAVRESLTKYLADPHERSQTAAVRGLGKLGDQKSVADLQKLADSSADDSVRREAKKAIDAIHKSTGEDATIRGLRERIEKLEKMNQEKEAKS